MAGIESVLLSERMSAAVKLCWRIFSKKVGSGIITINKEASMQLHFAYMLQQLLPLITLAPHEYFSIELETGVTAAGGSREIDLLFTGSAPGQKHSIAVEMKCYKTYASSGKKRGATDIFMKDVYFDLYLLEQYGKEHHSDEGISLVMTDLERLVSPKKKQGKCWDYDTSHGTTVNPGTYSTPAGGMDILFTLGKKYTFKWEKQGEFWFMLV